MRSAVMAVLVAGTFINAGCNTSPKAVSQPADLEQRVTELEKSVAEHEARLRRMKRNPSATTIVLSRTASGAGSCDTAKVLDFRVGNQHERHVRWDIETECNLFGGKIDLRFDANPQGQYPFPTPNLEARGGNRFVQGKIQPSANVDPGVFEYGIWLVPVVGDPRELADPELEIEPPPVVVAGSAAPPAKKQ